MYEHHKDKCYNFNHIDKLLNKKTINEITSSYNYHHKKLWLYKKPIGGLRNKIYHVISHHLFNSSWYCSWWGNNESHHTRHYTWLWVDINNIL